MTMKISKKYYDTDSTNIIPVEKDTNEYYGESGNAYEAIKVIEALGYGEGFCLGNVLKYVIRAGKKAGNSKAEDLRKAKWYLERALVEIEQKEAPSNIHPPQVTMPAIKTEYCIDGLVLDPAKTMTGKQNRPEKASQSQV